MTLQELCKILLEKGIRYPRIIETPTDRPIKQLLTNCADKGNIKLAVELCQSNYKGRAAIAKSLGYKVKVSKAKGFYSMTKE
jgi:RecB family endonuclease NucS